MEEQETYESEDTEQTEKMRLLNALAEKLLKKRNEAVEFRAASGIERQWREDEDAFDGIDQFTGGTRMLDYVTGEAPVKNDGPSRSKVVVNIIRGKCETAEGRFSDIQLPVDDKNYGLKITPVPELAKCLKDDRQAARNGVPLQKEDGTELTISDVAKMDQDKAVEKMKSMETEIDDQLTECNFNGECRKLIKSAVRNGTGIIKGPNVVKAVKKAWEQTEDGWCMQIKEDTQPASKWVNCWNVYPDPDVGEDINRAAYIWENSSILPRELRDLIGVAGYFEDQIIEILREEPLRAKVEFDKNKRHKVQNSTASMGNHYERWDYYGDLNREDLESLGVDVSHDDISQSFSACAVFINDRPVKVFLNSLPTGDMPYDFFQWTSVSGSPWGKGIPRSLIWHQRIITAAWRAMMDNAGDSSGANIVLGRGIEPVDGKWEITGKKIWYLDADEIDDVRKVFQQFQIENTQPQLQAVIELALRFIDMETFPQLFQGEHKEMPETLGATNIAVDSSNITLRSRVKLYDDQITEPHITRYYHYNMEYNTRNDIKGDYNVDARGVSALLQKDQMAQTLKEIMTAKADPDFNLLVDWEKATKEMLSALHLDVLKSDEDYKKAKEAQAKQQQPQDPRVVSAKIKTQGDMEKAKLTQQSDMVEIKTKGKIVNAELTAKAQEAERERRHQRAMKEMEFNVKMMEFSKDQGISLDKIKSELMRDSMKLRTQVALAGPDKKGPQILTPVVEPQGRAKDGRAFQD